MGKNYDNLKAALHGAKAIYGYSMQDIAAKTGLSYSKVRSIFETPEVAKLFELNKIARFLKIEDSALSTALFANG